MNAEAMTPSHPIAFADWVVGIGIDRSGISSSEMRKIGRLLQQMGTSVVRHARVRGINDDDDAEMHETALNAAEFVLGMARSFGDEVAAMDQTESRDRQVAGSQDVQA